VKKLNAEIIAVLTTRKAGSVALLLDVLERMYGRAPKAKGR
jgi:hypothetical protein